MAEIDEKSTRAYPPAKEFDDGRGLPASAPQGGRARTTARTDAEEAGARQPRVSGATLLAIGLFLAACGSLWNYLGATLHPNALTYSHAFFLEDILPTYNAARSILAGHGPAMYDPAVVHGYTYSPLFAWLFTPLAQLPWAQAGAIWYLLCHLWLWLAIAALAALFAEVLPPELLRPRAGRVPLIPLLLAVWLGIPPSVQASLDFGQVDYLMLALLAAAMLCLLRGRDASAGVLIVLAALLKITPLGLLAVLLVFHRWRALTAALATLAASVIVTSVDPRVGLQTWLHMPNGVNANFAFIFGQYANESLGSVAAHLLALLHYHLAPRLGADLGVAIAAILFAGALALGVWRDGLRSSRWLVAAAAAIGALLLASPLNWDHTYVAAAVPTAFLLGAMATRYLAEQHMRWEYVLGAFAAAVMAAWPMTAALQVPDNAGLHLRAYGTVLISARPLALLVITLLLLRYVWYPQGIRWPSLTLMRRSAIRA